MLHWLTEIMATVPDGDTRLVDLYANRGNADPLVAACALEGQEHDSQWLLAPEWIVVTGDEAVRDKAEEFGLKVLSNSEFAVLIDGFIHEHEREASSGSNESDPKAQVETEF